MLQSLSRRNLHNGSQRHTAVRPRTDGTVAAGREAQPYHFDHDTPGVGRVAAIQSLYLVQTMHEHRASHASPPRASSAPTDSARNGGRG